MDLKVPLGLGTMHWGNTPLDKLIAGRILTDETVAAIGRLALSRGVTLIDTAEGYGGGTSEARIGRLKLAAQGHLVATKFLPTFWRWTQGSFVRALEASNRRLGVETCELSFLHSPVHFRKPDVWIKGAARAYRAGSLKALGLSNFNAEQVRHAALAARGEGIPLVANQIMFSLLVHKSAALREAVQACREQGIEVLGYGVLGQGLLTPGLTPETLRSHRLAQRIGLTWDELSPLRQALSTVAERHGRTVSQVCLRWVIGQGVVPLVGTRSVEQLQDSLGALEFALTSEESAFLDDHALGYSTFDRAPWKRLLFLGFLSLLMTAYKASAAWPVTRQTPVPGTSRTTP